jgi:hypothetical protein
MRPCALEAVTRRGWMVRTYGWRCACGQAESGYLSELAAQLAHEIHRTRPAAR